MIEKEILQLISDRIRSIQMQRGKVTRVAVNGIERTGKTVLSKKLCTHLQCEGLDAVHVSIDGYHHIRSIRYRQGKDSAVGYYEDAYNEQAFVDKVLKSSQADAPAYIPAIHDLDTDEVLSSAPVPLPDKAIIITDGSYLFKEIYRPHWDLKIYLKTNFETARTRGAKRDEVLLGSLQAAFDKYEKRYHKASEIYIAENSPMDLADIVIDNTDFENLILAKGV